jgi:hypothetical protein
LTLFLGILFSSVGGVYFFYGKRTYSAPYLVCGVLLMVYPYFVSNVALMVVVGAGLIVIPVGITKGWFDR